MNEGMKFDEFNKEWLSHFASNISKKDLQNKVVKTGNYIWHIFSWELIEEKEYSTGTKARQEFDNIDKLGAWYIIPFEKRAVVQRLTAEYSTSKRLDEEIEIYVVARDFSWTYIKTHEGMCGPYFYKRKNVCKK